MLQPRNAIPAALAAALCLCSCATVRDAVRTVSDVAAVACEAFYGAHPEELAKIAPHGSDRAGLPLRELCALHDVARRFLPAGQAALASAEGAHGMAPTGAGAPAIPECNPGPSGPAEGPTAAEEPGDGNGPDGGSEDRASSLE